MQSVYSRLTAMCSGWTPARAREREAFRGERLKGVHERAPLVTVAVGRVDIGSRVQQELHKLQIAARQRVVERRAAAAVLAVVGVRSTLQQQLGNQEARLLVGDGVLISGGHLMESAVEIPLAHACTARGHVGQRCAASVQRGRQLPKS